MRKIRIVINSLLFCLVIIMTSKPVLSDDFIMPDWGYYFYREQSQITENTDKISYTKVRKEQSFDKYFDKQEVIIHKKLKNISPKQAGEIYLYNNMANDENAEKYIINNEENNFFACYCSQNKKKCEIIRFYNGFDGLIEIRYTHNNLWHFQNNIGSFISTQMRIEHIPYEFTIKKLAGKNKIIRL